MRFPWSKRNRLEPAIRPRTRSHPDPGTETKLQQIYSLRAAIARQELVIGEFAMQMTAARTQQDKASGQLRGSHHHAAQQEFELNMKTQRERIQDAQAGLERAEAFIASCSATIAELAAGITDDDLSYLGPGSSG